MGRAQEAATPKGSRARRTYYAGRAHRKSSRHSKKLEHHAAMLSLYCLQYNFARPHETLNGVSPARAAGLATRLWKLEAIVGLLEEEERPIITS